MMDGRNFETFFVRTHVAQNALNAHNVDECPHLQNLPEYRGTKKMPKVFD